MSRKPTETIHYSRCQMVPTPSSLAAQLGFLDAAMREIGIAFTIGDYDHHEDRLWLRHAGTTKPLWARAGGADTRLIGLSWHKGALPIFARPESGIETPAQLRNRRIAMVRVVNQPFDVERAIYLKPYAMALAAAGLTLADVRLVDTVMEREHTQNAAPRSKNIFVRIGEVFLDQLQRGEVDAIATNLPADTVRALQLRKIYDGREDPNLDAGADLRGLVVSGALLREHRHGLVRLVSQLVSAGDWAKAHHGDTLGHLARDLGLNEEVLRTRGIDAVELSQIDCAPDQIEVLRRKQDFLVATGLLERPASITDWIDASVLRDARALRTGGVVAA